MLLELEVRTVWSIEFICEDFPTAEFGAANPVVSQQLDILLRSAPFFDRCIHHGVYSYKNTLGVFNTIRIENGGLFVILHDGGCFDTHPLIAYLRAALVLPFPDARFSSYTP